MECSGLSGCCSSIIGLSRTCTPVEASALRLSPGTDIRDALDTEFERESRNAALVIAGIGSLRVARVRLARAAGPSQLEGDLETLTLARTIAMGGADLHMSVADAVGRVVGGQVAKVASCGPPPRSSSSSCPSDPSAARPIRSPAFPSS